MAKTILVTGAYGQLSSEMQALSSAYPQYDFLLVTKDELPIDNAEAVTKFFEENDIDICVNCAAYTAVDKAETEVEEAMAVNAIATGTLAAICSEKKILFIHISTDYVFDGNGSSPYKEDHPVSPVNAYGLSKLKGEQLAMELNPSTIIIRTSWVYSSFGNNFVKTMLRLMKERESLSVVDDQVGCPTYAADLAEVIMQIIQQPAVAKANPGIYHFSDEGVISWFHFAEAIKELSGSQCKVNPIPSSQYPTPAKRPHYSVMDTSKIKQIFNIAPPHWKASLEQCLKFLLT